MTAALPLPVPHRAQPCAQPRAEGRLRLDVKARGAESAIERLEQAGAARMLFAGRGVDAIMINTAGGVTGGDRFRTELRVAAGAEARLTTQGAERLYRAQTGETGRIDTRAQVAGRLDWLPQETIVFNGARVNRRFEADLTGAAQLLFVEPVVYGRAAMGERLTGASFRDDITLRRDGALLFRDTTRLTGNIDAQLARPAVAGGARAMALLLYAAPEAEAQLAPARRCSPHVSLIREGLLAARLLAADAFELRRTLVPLLALFTDLPRSWSL